MGRLGRRAGCGCCGRAALRLQPPRSRRSSPSFSSPAATRSSTSSRKSARIISGLGIKEAKELVEAGGKIIKEGVTKEEAAKIKKQLEDQGAVVEIK